MSYRTPQQIEAFIRANQNRMDGPQQWYGTEPNSYRKDWDSCTVRMCTFASWPYEQASGNQAIPLVYRTINEHREDFLCDRCYFPATPRDMRTLEHAGIPIHGIESKHQLLDFDVIGTSVSYQVLTINFIKQLLVSDIPPTREDRFDHNEQKTVPGRARDPEKWPMVIVGGQGYGAPELLANVVDCWFCGEVEDEPGNPGLGAVFERIATFKEKGRWSTDRVSCYADLAREFNFLYFPQFVDIHYDYEDRHTVADVLYDYIGKPPEGWYERTPQPSKQVVGITSNLEGMKLPIVKRFVKDMDAVEPLDNPPLLFVDPGMGSGDLETQRGCPAWCSFCALCVGGETSFVTRDGVRVLQDCEGTTQEVWTERGWVKADIAKHGTDVMNVITFAPAFLGWSEFAQRRIWKKTASTFSVSVRATEQHRWPLADGGETHHVKEGDFVKAQFAQDENHEEYSQGWVHGLTFGDGTLSNGPGRNSYAVVVRKDQPELLDRLLAIAPVSSIEDQTASLWRVRFWCERKLKEFPKTAEYSSAYVRGFIEGWDAADGASRARTTDRLRISSQHPQAEEWLRECAAYGGWVLTGVFTRKSLETNFGTRKNHLREFNLSRISAWKVVRIEQGDSPEPVFCATVPGVGFWTLANGVYTGNTYRQKPYRQRSVDYMVDFGKRLLNNTGGIHLAPFGPDFPMHTQKKALIKRLMEEVVDDLDASSMRVDDFIADPSYILLQAQANMDSVTLGLEGNSQRMRDLVGKGAADEDVKEALVRGIQAGIKKFKLYMIAFLPGEEEEDIWRLLNLAIELANIRDSMGSKAVIQFSWTPMLVEANTPFQWFGPTIPNYALGDVWEKLRDIHVDFKIGAKAQKDKIIFFQLAQRASREVGMAMVEAVCDRGEGSWGGTPRNLFEDMEKRLVYHGFLNGKADCYDEREKVDMFGWEHIDQGINTELMWVTYQQMREFLENTDASTYDENFSYDYHGNEWIARCDEKCYGRTCGVCDKKDLQLRRAYIQGAAQEIEVDLRKVKPIDQRTQAIRVRARVVKSEDLRFVMNDHWKYALRRAAYRAGVPITKRTVRFTSDAIIFKDWTCGVDYVEFALTKRVTADEMQKGIEKMNIELDGHLFITDWQFYPAKGERLRDSVDLSLYEMEIDTDPTSALAAIERWNQTDYVKMIFKRKSVREGMLTEEVNGKDYVEDLWLIRRGHSLILRQLVRGKASPYVVYASLFNKASWLEAAKYPAYRVEAFLDSDENQIDFFRPVCETCGEVIAVSPLETPFSQTHCPRHGDEQRGDLIEEAVKAS